MDNLSENENKSDEFIDVSIWSSPAGSPGWRRSAGSRNDSNDLNKNMSWFGIFKKLFCCRNLSNNLESNNLENVFIRHNYKN